MYDFKKQANSHSLLICFIKCRELQKQFSKNTFLYTRNIVLKQGRVTFRGFSTKAYCQLFCLK